MLKLWVMCFAIFPANRARVFLPHVPHLLRPSVPNNEDRMDMEDMEYLKDQDPEVTPGLFEGDMALTNETNSYWRVGLQWEKFPHKMWPNGTIPYSISPLYEPAEQATIRKAIRTLNFMTCIRFVPWDGKREDYLLIWPIEYPKGCWSFVGKQGGPQILSLQPPDAASPNCLGTSGRALHELMHAVGIFHEQSRNDRDKFVKIHYDNVIPKFKLNFEKLSLENTTYSFEYDYNSIMHYGKYYFSKERGKPTITATMPGVKKLGQRKGLSKGDCLKLNDLYSCFDDPRKKRKYFNNCVFRGL